MNIPDEFLRASVQGNLLRAVLDSGDGAPDAQRPKNLRVSLVLVDGDGKAVPFLEHAGGILFVGEQVITANQAGDVINPKSPDVPLEVIATDQPDRTELRYQVTITGDDIESVMWRAPAPAGGVLDVGVPVDQPAPEDIPEWERVLGEVEAARADVLAEAAAAGAARDQAEAARDQAEAFRDQAGEIASGDLIDDSQASTSMTYSSSKIAADLAAHKHSAADITSGTLNTARLPASSTSARGAVELATTTEATAGTDTQRAVTPAGVKAVIDALPVGRGQSIRFAVDHGLTGSGDETAALQAFLALGGTLWFEPGKTYSWSGSTAIEVPAGTTLVTNGARFVKLGESLGEAYMVKLREGVVADHFEFHWAGGEVARGVEIFGGCRIGTLKVTADTVTGHGAWRRRSAKIIGNNVWIGEAVTHNWSYSLMVETALDVTVDRVTITGHVQGVYILSSRRVTIGAGSADDVNVMAAGTAGQNSVLVDASFDVRVRDFHSVEASEHGFRVGGQTMSSNILFDGCTARQSGVGAGGGACGFKVLGATTLNNTEGNYHRNIILSNCQVIDSAATNGANTEAFSIGKCINVTVSNCLVDSELLTTSAYAGLLIYGSRQVTITNFTANRVLTYGLRVESRASGDGVYWGGEARRIIVDGWNQVFGATFLSILSTDNTVTGVDVRGAMVDAATNVISVSNATNFRNGAVRGSFTGFDAAGFSGTDSTLLELDVDVVRSSPACRTGSRMLSRTGAASERRGTAWVNI